MNTQQKYSKLFNTLKQAQSWASKQEFEDIWHLIYDREEEKYQLVNESHLYYLENFFDLDMRIIETYG